MATLTGIIASVWDVLKMVVPSGVDPILFFLTFLITSVLVFVILQVIKFFKGNNALSAIIAIVIAYFTASSVFVTIMISKLFPNIGLAIMAIVGVMLVLVFLAPNMFEKGFNIKLPIGIAIFVVIIWLTWIFAAPALESAGILAQISSSTGFAITNEDVALVITIAVIIGGLFMLFKKPTPPGQTSKFFKIVRGGEEEP